MSVTATTLAAACGASDLTLSVTSTTGFPTVGTVGAHQPVVIDGEAMFCTGVPASGTIVVAMRGSDGGNGVAHAILAPVFTSALATDFASLPSTSTITRPPFSPFQTTIGANGVIAVPADVRPVVVNITKATALSTTTLAAPSVANNGAQLTITSETAAAHVITATGLINDGTSGAPHNTLTFAAFAGASITLVAQNGLWNVVANNNVTVS
jgi:hypothetical protein